MQWERWLKTGRGLWRAAAAACMRPHTAHTHTHTHTQTHTQRKASTHVHACGSDPVVARATDHTTSPEPTQPTHDVHTCRHTHTVTQTDTQRTTHLGGEASPARGLREACSSPAAHTHHGVWPGARARARRVGGGGPGGVAHGLSPVGCPGFGGLSGGCIASS
jgi:hypothetical protein